MRIGGVEDTEGEVSEYKREGEFGERETNDHVT